MGNFMRILMISDHADPLAKIGSLEAGGQNIYVMNLASLLAKLGLEIDVYTRWDQTSKQEVVHPQPRLRVIRVKAGPKSYMPRDSFLEVIDEFTANIEKRITKEKLRYHAIFSHYWFSGLIGLRLAATFDLPQTHVYHSIGRMRFETFKNFKPNEVNDSFFKVRDEAERRIAEKATSIISTSPVERDAIVAFFGIPASKIAVIPIGVDTSLFRPYHKKIVRRRLGLPVDQPLVLYAGRLEWRKGIATLLYALKRLADSDPHVHLCIVGGGNTKKSQALDATERGRLQRIVADLGLSERVRFIGSKPQSQMAMYYAAADVCAVPSYYEPFGIVPLEAMACATPVVGSRIGGMQFTIEDDITGHLVKPRSYVALAEKLHLVLVRGSEAYAEAARHRVLRQFAWPKIARAVAAHLSRLGKAIPTQTPLTSSLKSVAKIAK